jgi:transmembrane sensor
MSDPRPQGTRAQEEAAEWLARLGNQPISTRTVRDFRDWRDDPANDAAYEEAEAFWEASGEQAADPEILRMTAEALARRRRGWREWLAMPVLRISLVAASALAIGLAVLLSTQMFPSYATGAGEQRVVRLDDGSRVHLNVNSQVRVRFSAGERRLVLSRGEAFFDVAHDSHRPFVVDANGTRVRALGTKFDVRNLGRLVQVTLVEGRVQVKQDARPQAWTLAPNQRLVVSEDGEVRETRTDAVRSTSWTTGRLSFRETPLSEAVAEVNRYGKDRVVVQGDDLRGRLVSGYFDVGDTESFVNGVAMLFDLQASPAKDGVITLRERPATGA